MTMKSILLFLKSKDPYYWLARYALAIPMLGFGLMKLLGYQFHSMFPPSSAWGQRLDQVSGMQLTWAFLGHSPWLRIVLGFFEFLPALLLLFRRTTLMGAILMLPMTLSVLMINYAMHLWSNTQMLSVVLVSLNLLLFIFEKERISTVLRIVLGEGVRYKYFAIELVLALVLIGNAVKNKGMSDHGASGQNVLTGDWLHKHPNEFTLLSERLGDSTLPLKDLKIYFDPYENYSEINDQACNRDGHAWYALDEKEKTLSIPKDFIRNKRSRDNFYYLSGDFNYELPGDKTLILSRKEDGEILHEWKFSQKVIAVNSEY